MTNGHGYGKLEPSVIHSDEVICTTTLPDTQYIQSSTFLFGSEITSFLGLCNHFLTIISWSSCDRQYVSAVLSSILATPMMGINY
jgi:hypothetical protein